MSRACKCASAALEMVAALQKVESSIIDADIAQVKKFGVAQYSSVRKALTSNCDMPAPQSLTTWHRNVKKFVKAWGTQTPLPMSSGELALLTTRTLADFITELKNC